MACARRAYRRITAGRGGGLAFPALFRVCPCAVASVAGCRCCFCFLRGCSLCCCCVFALWCLLCWLWRLVPFLWRSFLCFWASVFRSFPSALWWSLVLRRARVVGSLPSLFWLSVFAPLPCLFALLSFGLGCVGGFSLCSVFCLRFLRCCFSFGFFVFLPCCSAGGLAFRLRFRFLPSVFACLWRWCFWFLRSLRACRVEVAFCPAFWGLNCAKKNDDIFFK